MEVYLKYLLIFLKNRLININGQDNKKNQTKIIIDIQYDIQ